jgi:hypothetical protein
MNSKGKQHPLALGILAGIVLVIVVGGFLVYFMPGVLPVSVTNPVVTSNPVTQPTGSNPLMNVNRPIPFVTTNALTGAIVGSTNITILTPSGGVLETLTSDGSTGKATSSNAYQSGTQLVIQVAKTNYVTQEYSFTVPQMSSSDTYGTTNNYQTNLPVMYAGSYTVKIVDSAGTSYTTSSTTYNWTAKGTTSDTFTCTIYETTNNAGWKDSHDVINNVDWNFVVDAVFNTTSLSITGQPWGCNWGGTMYYGWQIPQSSLYRQTQGYTTIAPGVYSFSFQVNKGSFASGEGTLTLTPYDYAAENQFTSTGSFGPNAAAAGSAFVLLFIV